MIAASGQVQVAPAARPRGVGLRPERRRTAQRQHVAEHGRDRFAEAFLRDAGLNWAAELIAATPAG